MVSKWLKIICGNHDKMKKAGSAFGIGLGEKAMTGMTKSGPNLAEASGLKESRAGGFIWRQQLMTVSETREPQPLWNKRC